MTDPEAKLERKRTLEDIAEEIEQSDGIALMLMGGVVQLGIRRTAIVVAALRDRRKYSLLESQFANCHKEIKQLREALLATTDRTAS